MDKAFKMKPLAVERATLGNGLRVVLNRDDSAPVVSLALYYDVGSRNERKGRTGFAHLFEHMMFQGSENVGKAEHFQYIMKAGGTMNGTTSSERTNYYETLPADQLPLALWLESDRMRSLAVTQENLDNQREAVKEEKRLRYDNQPYGQVFDLVSELIFKNFANSHSTIGSMEDLDDASVNDVREFFKAYYAPNNAVVVLSGAFESGQALSLIEEYFGDIPAQAIPPQVDVSEPDGVAERFREYQDRLAPLPAFLFGWKIPPRSHSHHDALDLAGRLLYDGDSSRLYQKLVKGQESVIQLFGYIDERRGPSAMLIGSIPKPENDGATIRAVILGEIEDLASHGPSAEEMEKLGNQILNDAVRARQSSLSRAQMLAEYELYDGDASLANGEVERLLNISATEIRDAVCKYLMVEDRTLLEVIPGAGATGGDE